MRKRSEVRREGGERTDVRTQKIEDATPLNLGPISPNTGGGLNAIESYRVACGKSPLVVGWSFEYVGREGKGLALCQPCMKRQVDVMPGEVLFDPVTKAGRHAAPEHECASCGARFKGELPDDSPRRK